MAFDRLGNYAIVGELALTGETRPIKGILAMALQAVSEAREGLLVPTANAAEAAVVEGLNVYPVGSLAEAVGFVTGQVDMDPEAVDLDELFAQHSHMGAGKRDRSGKAGQVRYWGAGKRDRSDIVKLDGPADVRAIFNRSGKAGQVRYC